MNKNNNSVESVFRKVIELYTSGHESLSVKANALASMVIVEIQTDLVDFGKVIGKSAGNLNSLKRVAGWISANRGVLIKVEVLDPFEIDRPESNNPSTIEHIAEVIGELISLAYDQRCGVTHTQSANYVAFVAHIPEGKSIDEYSQESLRHLISLFQHKHRKNFYLDFKNEGQALRECT